MFSTEGKPDRRPDPVFVPLPLCMTGCRDGGEASKEGHFYGHQGERHNSFVEDKTGKRHHRINELNSLNKEQRAKPNHVLAPDRLVSDTLERTHKHMRRRSESNRDYPLGHCSPASFTTSKGSQQFEKAVRCDDKHVPHRQASELADRPGGAERQPAGDDGPANRG